MDFSAELLERYKQDPEAAKAYYYSEKMGWDVNSPEGSNRREQMLIDYLTGMQWVLYYYYRGVQHWSYYYPYHYPPMISDIKNIGELVPRYIEKFENSGDNRPFEPNQQLLTILPPSSIKRLMPHDYQKFLDKPEFQ